MTTPQPRFVDMRVQLWQLLTGVLTIMSILLTMTWNIAGQNNKLEQLVVASIKMEKRSDDKDRVTEDLKDRQDAAERRADKLEYRLDSLERSK